PFYQGYIKLFIVSKDSRGLGVGKKLLSYQLDYMNKMNVRSLYLYTDTICNFGFYDANNFQRVNQKEYVDPFEQKLSVFLYQYDLVK
ncbi:MAG: GNAT family N-acetyltransferase, partial [Brevinema sp.]